MSEIEDLQARIAELEEELAGCDCSEHPVPFYASTKVLNSEWIKGVGPAAIHVSALNTTFVAWYMVGEGSEKGAQIAAYDHTSGTWSERYKVGNYSGLADDDHGQVSLCQDADGYFYAFYGSHATSQPWSISTNPNDITSWTRQASLSGTQSYPHAVVVGSKIYVFVRNDTNLSRRTFDVRSATPASGSATFSGLTALVDLGADSRAYMGEARAVGTDIHFVGSRANAADTYRKGIYYFIYDTVTGAVKNHDGSVTVAAGSLPVSLATANASFRLFDHGTGQGDIPSLCFDTSGDPHLLFADNGGFGASYSLKHMTRTSGVWSSPVTVDAIYPRFPNIGSIVTYAAVPGASGTVEAWYCNYPGDKMRSIYSAGVWGTPETILAAVAGPLIGSQAVRDAHADLRSIFCEVSNSMADVNAFPTKRFGYGDSGPLSAVVPMTPVDPMYRSVSLLLGFEHRNGATQIINEADSCYPLTLNGNAQIDTSQSAYGSASLKLDGSGDFVTSPHNADFSVSNGDFCLEMSIRRIGTSKLQCITAKRPGSGSSEWACYISAANLLTLQAFTTSAACIALTGLTTINASQWYDVSFERQGSTWRIFCGGALEASGTESAAPAANTQLLHIGRDPSNAARDFSGWLDEFRFTSGGVRYTAAYTPLGAAFPRR